MSQTPLAKPEIVSGTLIDNRYIIQKLLGQGGLGRTYLAFDTRRFNEPCVLKEFAPIGTGENGLERCRNLFKREARILHQLQHPQIPRFLACFEGDGRLFLVQEYVDGQTYSHLLRERQNQGQVFTQNEVAEWLKKLLSILEYVHEHNIIHRDISPDNIMLPDGNNEPVLIDFGVGKQIADFTEGRNSDLATFVGKMSLVGKVGYAPREQISLGLCSPSSDLYALGVTAIVLLTGRDPSLLMDQFSLEWKWRYYTDVSDAFAKILDKMLADTPNKRYQTANQVVSDLESLKEPKLDFELRRIDFFAPESTTQSNSIGTTPDSYNQIEETIFSLPLNQPTNPPTNPPTLSSQQLPSLESAFVKRCQQELAYHIGPMASVIIEEVLAQSPHASPQDFVELIMREIPDTQAAFQFKQHLFS